MGRILVRQNGNHYKSALHSRNLMICAFEVPRFSFVTMGRDIENEAWSGSNILIPFLHHLCKLQIHRDDNYKSLLQFLASFGDHLPNQREVQAWLGLSNGELIYVVDWSYFPNVSVC